MATNIRLWNLTKPIEVNDEIKESITKITNIENHIYLQTSNNHLYHGEIQTDEDNISTLQLQCSPELRVLDIDSCQDNLYIVDQEGSVFKCSKNLEKITEIHLYEDYHCTKGHTGMKCKMKVHKIAISDYGQLFITEQGHLWASGYMPQIRINTDLPKKVSFFSGRVVHSVNVGNDFAIAIVSKQMKVDEDSEEEDVFTSNCPECLSASQLTSPASETSVGEICPLGVKLQGRFWKFN